MKYFVTGTDTGVGKTYVTVAMTAGLRRAGRPARAVKPIETGWSPGNTDRQRRRRRSRENPSITRR